MGVLSSIFEKRYDHGVALSGLIQPTASGVNVTVEGSLKSTVVFACVRVLAESISSLPLILYRRDGDEKARAPEHPLYSLLHDLPNPEMTSVELRETLMGHLALWGNAFCEIERNGRGAVVGLWPLRADRMKVSRRGGRLIYNYMLPDGKQVDFTRDRIWHIKGLGPDGMVGYSPISLARQAVGLTLATEQYGATFFGNGAKPASVLEHPGQMSEKALGNLRASMEAMHGGLSNAHRMMILEEGMQYKQMSLPPDDAQFLETRKFQVTEIARMFRVPPHMVFDLERATFSNIEHLSIEFVVHTMRPWLVRWEQSIARDLLTPAERRQYFTEHLVDGLLRGDIKSRYEAYAVGHQNGWLSANDIRSFENMNPITDGDLYLVPLNMVPAEQVGQDTQPPAEPAQREARIMALVGERRALEKDLMPLFDDIAQRVTRREINDLRRAIDKYLVRGNDPVGFLEWLTEFYRDFSAYTTRQFGPLLLTLARTIKPRIERELGQELGNIDDYTDKLAEGIGARQAGSGENQLRLLIEENEDQAAAVTQRLDEWHLTRADKLASNEVVRQSNAIAKGFYLVGGVELLRWVASGENCPYCRDLDGKVVGVNQFFLNSGMSMQPDGADWPLTSRDNIGHPPLHRGCDCQIVAVRR